MSSDASGTLIRQTCEFCGAEVSTLRRGRCWGCFQKWEEAQPVGIGAQCVVCGERRRDNLQRVELAGRWIPMCHLCAVKTRQLPSAPRSLESIRERLQRDRRYGDRRHGRADTRIAQQERRVGERRVVTIDEADILWEEDLPIIEIVEAEAPEHFDDPTLLFERDEESPQRTPAG